MKTSASSIRLLASVLPLLAIPAFAAPSADLATAAKKLADAPSYAWTSTTQIAHTDFPAMPSEGVTEKGGFTVTTRTFNGNSSQTVRKGTELVMQNRDGDWVTMEEMRAQFSGGQAGGGGGQRGGGRGGFGGGLFGGAANPAETLGQLAAKLKNLQAEGDTLTATVTGEEAATLLAPPGGRGGQGQGPKYDSITVKFWLKDGAITQYSTHTLGTMTLPGGEDRELDTTTTVEFKNIGTAKVEVPEAAKKKFTS